MTEDERRKIGTFRGIDMNINREKLQQMAAEEGIELNFEKWDELLRDIRIEESDDSNEKPNDSSTKPKFVYNFNGQLIKTFNNTKECAEFYGISRESVASYSRSERPYYKFGIVITNELKDEKHKPYVRKRRLWFNGMFNTVQSDGVLESQWRIEPSESLQENETTLFIWKSYCHIWSFYLLVVFLGEVQYGTSPFDKVSSNNRKANGR